MAIDIANFKTQFRSIMLSANTTTATYDLSTGLSPRVQKILKINPLKIPIQPSFFPYVTIYADTKPITFETIAKNQLIGKRSTEFNFNVLGAVWQPIVTNVLKDDADEEVEQLMENIEEVIRRNFTINNAAKWTKPTEVAYHSIPIDEQTSLRVGSMNLMAKIFY